MRPAKWFLLATALSAALTVSACGDRSPIGVKQALIQQMCADQGEAVDTSCFLTEFQFSGIDTVKFVAGDTVHVLFDMFKVDTARPESWGDTVTLSGNYLDSNEFFDRVVMNGDTTYVPPGVEAILAGVRVVSLDSAWYDHAALHMAFDSARVLYSGLPALLDSLHMAAVQYSNENDLHVPPSLDHLDFDVANLPGDVEIRFQRIERSGIIDRYSWFAHGRSLTSDVSCVIFDHTAFINDKAKLLAEEYGVPSYGQVYCRTPGRDFYTIPADRDHLESQFRRRLKEKWGT